MGVCMRSKITAYLTAVLTTAPVFAGADAAGSVTSAGAGSNAATSTDGGAGDSSAGELGLQEVVVTAQKRTERIKDVPMSISQISGDALEMQESNSLAASVSAVPGVNVNDGGTPGQTQITIRGISMGSTINGSLVGTYIDDAPVGSSSPFMLASNLALDLLPYDLDRLEILRGPQGTLYGASTMGGLVKYVLKDPSLTKFDARVGGDLQYIDNSNQPTGGFRGMVNVPVISDVLGLRLSAFHQHTAGYIDNVGLGVAHENPITQNGGRVVFLWEPAQDLEVRGSMLLQDTNAQGNAAVTIDAATSRPYFGRYSRYTATPEFLNQHVNFYSLSVNWHLNFADLSSTSSWSRTGTSFGQDLTYGWQPLIAGLTNNAVTNGLAPYTTNLNLAKYTQEVRLTSPTTQSLQWLVGGFYTNEDGTDGQYGPAWNAAGQTIDGVNPLIDYTSPNKYREIAGFADLTYVFTPWFDLTAGTRYSKNHQDWDESLGGSLIGSTIIAHASSEEAVTTWMVSPRFHVNPDLMVYGRVATGYRPGGPNGPFPGIPISQVNSDRLTNYEVGTKGTFFEKRLDVDLSAYYIKWDRIQVSELSPQGFTYFANGGTASSSGLEFASAFQVARGLTAKVTAAFTNAHLTQDIPSLAAISGSRLPLSPRWSDTFSLDYAIPGAGSLAPMVGASYRHVGSVFNNIQGTALALPMGSQNIVDLYAAATFGQVTGRLYLKNATNNESYTNLFNAYNPFDPQHPQFVPVQPRTVGVSLDWKY